MAEMSRRFNFDDFDELCREALDERMAQESAELEEDQKWGEEQFDRVFHGIRPGEIGGVVVQLTFNDHFSDHPRLFDPDDAA